MNTNMNYRVRGTMNELGKTYPTYGPLYATDELNGMQPPMSAQGLKWRQMFSTKHLRNPK